MNREERRAQSRAMRRDASEYAKYIVKRDAVKNAKKAQLERNGITADDLRKAYEQGKNESIAQMSEFAMKMIYCGFALALKREFKFGAERVLRTLRAADQIILEELTTDDIIDRVSKELGIEMRFNGEKGDELFDI